MSACVFVKIQEVFKRFTRKFTLHLKNFFHSLKLWLNSNKNTGHYTKNCKHFCTRLEDKSLSTCAPFIVCQRTVALSMHSLHPLQHIVTAAVIREVIKTLHLSERIFFRKQLYRKTKHSNYIGTRRTIPEVVGKVELSVLFHFMIQEPLAGSHPRGQGCRAAAPPKSK
jgi:hypothetical protein